VIFELKLSLIVGFAAWGFGSCHSFGVAVGLRGYGMCQMRWAFGGKSF
jgi:hypothetical protein